MRISGGSIKEKRCLRLMSYFANNIIYTVDPKIPQAMLKAMLEECKSLSYAKSLVNGADSADLTGEIAKVRSSEQCWLCWDHWIAGIMHNIFISANNDYFNYDLDHFDSGIQVTKYEVGQEYGYHIDQLPPHQKLPRKLSMSLLLNDNFTGGEFEFYNSSNYKYEVMPTKTGTSIIFPSWVVHRVKPVKSGVRYSLVAWMNGPQFK